MPTCWNTMQGVTRSTGNWLMSWLWGLTVVRRQVTQARVTVQTALFYPMMCWVLLSDDETKVGPACSRRTCSARINSLVSGWLPWRMTGWRCAKEKFELWTRPPTCKSPDSSTVGCSVLKWLLLDSDDPLWRARFSGRNSSDCTCSHMYNSAFLSSWVKSPATYSIPARSWPTESRLGCLLLSVAATVTVTPGSASVPSTIIAAQCFDKWYIAISGWEE